MMAYRAVALLALVAYSWSAESEDSCATDRWKEAGSPGCANSTEIFESDESLNVVPIAPPTLSPSLSSAGVLFPSGPGLVFAPPSIDWGVKASCVPHFSSVNITNNVAGRVVEILSVATSSNPQFIVNKFRPSSLAMGESTQLKIIFLPRSAGAVSASLLVRTSVGGYFVELSGVGEPNQYGLQPFTDAELPMGKVYNPPIVVHNPLDVPLQIKEVFTTEKFLHLKLPKNGDVGGQAASDAAAAEVAVSKKGKGGAGRSVRMWTVAPRSSKHIINLSFQSHTPGKYNGYIHVKTDRDHLLIPVAVVVLRRSVYAYPREIDFGSLALGSTARVPVALLNARESGLAIKSVHIRPSDPRLSLSVTGKYLKGSAVRPRLKMTPFERLEDALALTYAYPLEANASLSADHLVEGKILLVTNQTAPLEIAYTARLLRGALTTSTAPTLLFSISAPDVAQAAAADGEEQKESSSSVSVKGENLTHVVRLVNTFEVPARIESIVVADRDGDFTVTLAATTAVAGAAATAAAAAVATTANDDDGDDDAEGAYAYPTIVSGDAFPEITVTLNPSALRESGERGVLLRTSLVIETNVTTKRIPIIVYDRRLNVIVAVEDDGSSGVSDAAVAEDGSTASSNNVDAPLQLNFGRMATKEKRTRVINVTNSNPTTVTLRRGNLWQPLALTLVGVYNGDDVAVSAAAFSKESSSDEKEESSVVEGAVEAALEEAEAAGRTVWSRTVTLQPGDVASFSVTLQAPSREKIDEAADAIVFVTSVERVAIAAQYETVTGALKLTPSTLVFDPVFPGTVMTKRLFASSSFAKALRVVEVLSTDSRVQIEVNNGTLKTGTRSGIAQISFNASRNCSEQLAICDLAPSRKLLSTADRVTTEALEALRRYNAAWRRLRSSTGLTVQTQIHVKTALQRAIAVNVHAVLKQPKVCGISMKFPLSQIGVVATKHVVVENPSDVPLKVRLLLPRAGEIPTAIAEGHPGGKRAIFKFAKDAIRSAVVEPHSTAQLGPVLFEPAAKMLYETSLYVSNNLTRLAKIALSGRGGSGRMVLKAGGVLVKSNGLFVRHDDGTVEVAANSPDGIMFVSNESHVKSPSSDGEISKPSPSGAGATDPIPGWGQVRGLRVTNNGDLAMTLHGVHIPGEGCEFAGFTVEPCIGLHKKGGGGGKKQKSKGKKGRRGKKSYTLAPKESFDVWVTFKHDLSSCSVASFRHVLQFDTSLGMQMYPLTVKTRGAIFAKCEESVLKQAWFTRFGITPRRHGQLTTTLVFVLVCAALIVCLNEVKGFLRHRTVREIATCTEDIVTSLHPPQVDSSTIGLVPVSLHAPAQAAGAARVDTVPSASTAASKAAAAAAFSSPSSVRQVSAISPTRTTKTKSNDVKTVQPPAASAVSPATVAKTRRGHRSAPANKVNKQPTKVAPSQSGASATATPSLESRANALSIAMKTASGSDAERMALAIQLSEEAERERAERKRNEELLKMRQSAENARLLFVRDKEERALRAAQEVRDRDAVERERLMRERSMRERQDEIAAQRAAATAAPAGPVTDLQREIALLKEQNLAWEEKQRKEEDDKARELDRARLELAKLREQNRLRQALADEQAAKERRRTKDLERKLATEAKQSELAKQEAQLRAELELAKKRRQLDEEFKRLNQEKARIQKMEAEKKMRKQSKRKEKEAKKAAAKAAARAERAQQKQRHAARRSSSGNSADFDDNAAALDDEDRRESLLDQLSLIGNVLDDTTPPRGGGGGDPSWGSDPISIGTSGNWGASASATGGSGSLGSSGGFGPLADVAPSPFSTFGTNLFSNPFGTSPPSGGGVPAPSSGSSGDPSLAPHWSSPPPGSENQGFSSNPLGDLFSTAGAGAGGGDEEPFNPDTFAFEPSSTAFGEGSFFGDFDDGDGEDAFG